MSSASNNNSSNNPSMSINALLKKTEHYDKDERYMATSDLCELLKRHGSNSGTVNSNNGDPTTTTASSSTTTTTTTTTTAMTRMDVTTERRICTAVLRLLHDKSNDVQAIAVKTLGVLLTTVQQEQVLEIADSLADQVLDAGKTELRDVYAIGLRTLVKTVPSSMGDAVSQRLVGRLLDGIQTSGKEEIVLCCLDILTDVLGRFGATAMSVARQHEPILQMCLQQLTTHSSPVVRKRSGTTMGCLSVVLSDPLLVRMVEALLSQIDRAEGVIIGRSISATSSISHAAAAAAPAGRSVSTSSAMSTGSSSSSAQQISDTRALIRTMCTISGAVGHRLGQAQIDRMIPIFLRFTNPEDAITGDDEDHDELLQSQQRDARMKDNDDNDDDEEDEVDRRHPTKGLTEEEAAAESANELRESCFMGFESFVLRCPTEVEPHMDKIVQAALAYMSFDPNYSYGDDDDDNNNNGTEEDMQAEEEQEQEEDEEEEFGDDDDDDLDDDDDDESWKVRRSAIRALKAVVEAKKHDPSSLWTTTYKVRRGKSAIVASALVARFKEREENCRVDVIDCFTRLLTVTIKAASAGVVSFQEGTAAGAAASDAVMDDTTSNSSTVAIIDLRTQYAPNLVKACEKLLSIRKGGDRSKSSALSLLATLSKAPGGVGGASQIQSVFRHIQAFLAKDNPTTTSLQSRDSSSKTLRLDALSLIHIMLANNNHNPVDIRKGLLSTILPDLCQAVKEQWYKVIAEALRALAQVPRFFLKIGYDHDTNNNNAAADAATKQKERDYVAGCLYNAIEPLLAAHDVDQEIKECALAACASLLSSLHTNLSVTQKQRTLSLLLDRLKNETTRITAIRTLSAIAAGTIANTETVVVGTGTAAAIHDNRMDEEGDNDDEVADKIDLSPILADAISTMASFLKLQSRSLKQSSLEALYTVVTNHGSSASADAVVVDGKLYATLLQEVGNLIVDSDLHLSHLSLRVSVSVLKVCPSCGPAVKSHVLPNALVLSTSPLLQDLALDSLLATLQQIVVSNVVDFHELLNMLRTRLDNGSGLGKNTLGNLAKCIAVITAVTTPENRLGVVSQTLSSLEGSKTPSETSELRHVQLSLLVSGDLGRTVDLSAMEGVADRLQKIYLEYFDSSSEDLKLASAYALGRAAIGAKAVFLPVIVDSLEQSSQKKQYLLLSALREFIQCYQQHAGGDDIQASIALIIPHLEGHCSDKEEGVRTMVAECVGSLTCLQPAMLLPKLQEIVNGHLAINAPEGTVPDGDEESKKNALACWTVATSIKLAIAGKVDPSQLATYIPSFLKLLQQQELSVRNAALLMVYSAVHHMPQILAGLMKEHIMPSLYEVATFKLERKVDLGPFTHTVDDALPLRKAALSIFATCVENLPASLDIGAFMPILAKALGDVEDVQLQAYQIVCSMCVRQPTYLVAAVESFVDPLEKTINKKAGQKTGTELERLNDWIKGALRAMLALSRLEGAMNCRKFADLCDRTRMNPKFRPIMESLEEER